MYLVCPCQVRDNCRWFDPSMKGTVSRWACLWVTVYAQHGYFLQKPSQNELWLAWSPLLLFMLHLCYGQDYSVLLWCCRGALLRTGLFSIAMMLQRSSVTDRTLQYCYDTAEELCYGQDSSVLLWYCRGALLWTGLFSIAMMLQRSWWTDWNWFLTERWLLEKGPFTERRNEQKEEVQACGWSHNGGLYHQHWLTQKTCLTGQYFMEQKLNMTCFTRDKKNIRQPISYNINLFPASQ